jgi:CubicO group peptidase (beta-lactamase class C family)
MKKKHIHTKMLTPWLLSCLLVFAHANQKIAQCPPSKSSVERSLLDARIPGMAAVVVDANGVVYEQGYGFTSPPIFVDLHPVDPVQSVFVLASISKTFIAVAAMQLVELHLLDLDTDINTYLPLGTRVRHPLYPNHTITMRNLLSHTASIGPNFREEMKHYVPGDDFTKTNLSEIILSYLGERGNWLPDPPGTVVNYSNVGAGFAAVIIEQITHMSFETYVHEQILEPLCIDRKEASYRLSDFQERPNDLIEHYISNTSWLDQARDWLPQLNFTIVSVQKP